MPIHNIIILSVLGAAIIASIILAVVIANKKETAKILTKGILVGCLCVVFALTAYTSVAAATDVYADT